MIRIFGLGVLLGVALTAALLHLFPAVDQHREASIVSVQPNGGNTETFHVNLPQDRLLLGSLAAESLPPGLDWPADVHLADSRTELFKIRNDNDVVVGVASRIAGPVAGSGRVVEWTLHLPARGSVYVSMPAAQDSAGVRDGRMLAGTREFGGMQGRVRERFVGGADETPEGRIEIVTALVGGSGEPE